MLRSLRFWIGAAVSLGFLGLFFARADLGELGSALATADYRYAVPALAIYFVGVWLRAMRWRYLLLPLRSLPSHRLFSIVVIGYMVNNILPLRAGELVRAYILGEKEGLSKAAVLATIAVERTFDGLTLLLFVALVALVLPLASWLSDAVRAVALLFIGALALLLAMALRESWAQRITAFAARFLPQGAAQRGVALLELFLSGLHSLRHPRLAALALAMSALSWLAEAGMYYLVGLSFGLGQSFVVLILVTSAANLAISLPSSQGGIGPFEYFAAATLTLFGVAAATASAYALALHALLLLPVIGLGLALLWMENLSLSEVARLRAAEVGPDMRPLPQGGEK